VVIAPTHFKAAEPGAVPLGTGTGRKGVKMPRIPLTLLLVLILGLASAPGHADEPLDIATRHVPPFAIKGDDGRWEGISIVLWETIAEQLGLRYRYREMSLQEMLDAVSAGKADAAVGALTITAQREAAMDFSHPFMRSGLGIAVPRGGGIDWGDLLKRFLSGPFWYLVLGLCGLLLAVGTVIWLLERRGNDQFRTGPAEGIGAGFWWSAVTMTTVGYGDKAPRTVAGRSVAVVWMFASVILTASFTAAIASILTVGELGGTVKGERDLARARVVTVAHSTSAAYLRTRHYGHTATTDVDEALRAVAAGTADAAVYDAPLLRYQVSRAFADRLMVLREVFETQDYGIALPQGSPHREAVNRALLAYLRSERWQELQASYLGLP
jgi:ABC-type amino acid transport substrate-binding protein